MELADFQQRMADTYGDRDAARGIPATVAWLAEETGELAKAVRKGSPGEQLHELGDVLAWLASLANQLGLSLDAAVSGLGMSTSSTPGAAASNWRARSCDSGRSNSTFSESEWPVNTPTRTQVHDTARSGISRILRLSLRNLISSLVSSSTMSPAM